MTGKIIPDGINLANPLELLIGGRWVAPAQRGTLEITSPDTGKVCGIVAEAGPADMDAAVSVARRAFDEGPWPRMTPRERADFLRKLAEGLERRASELSTAWTAQIGALATQTPGMTADATAAIVRCADLAGSFEFVSRRASREAAVALVVREPAGVAACIAPWNFPYDIMINKVAPALLAGCTVIMKPAPETPLEAYIVAEVAEEIGLPAGVLNLVPANREAADHLVQNAGVDLVSFTGSTLAGQRIGEVCGRRVARATLELGGKSPAVVLDDVNIEDVARMLTGTITFLCGQVCAMLTRVIVSQNRHDALAAAIAKEMANIKVGRSTDAETAMGPIALRRQLDRVLGYIEQGKSEGADLVFGGKRLSALGEGFFIEPALFANVRRDAAIAQDEIFGPVLSLIACRDEADAVDIANSTRYGLNGSVITNDAKAAYRIARAVRSGTLAQNGLRADFSLPYGGFKQSGIGREGGAEGLLGYCETKTILLDAEP
jgi:aldehyde dehydrogenase (NAD+)